MIASTQHRVEQNTAESINAQIREKTEESVVRAGAGGPVAIDRRLEELDQEWDIERILEANAAGLSLVGVILGGTVDRRWFALPAVVSAFLLQHAVQGWCPPLPLFRRLGVRTTSEIAEERYALKAMRGDFHEVPTNAYSHAPGEAISALDAAST